MSTYGPTKLYEKICDICVERYGSSRNDVVVFVIENNPGIEDYGILLPPGLTINLPDLPVTQNQEVVRRQIFLWN